jgi:TonB family protein
MHFVGARILLLLIAYTGTTAFAQIVDSPEGSKADVEVVTLSTPIYPPLARTARVWGDVEVALKVRKDGTVASAFVSSGHPLLQQAALQSARKSAFECRGCTDETTDYMLTYSFQMLAGPGWPCPEDSGIRIQRAGNHVTLVAQPQMVQIDFSITRVRSLECAYLWKCGLRGGGEDFYFYRTRSAKCLGLRACGHRLREPFATCKRLHRTIL